MVQPFRWIRLNVKRIKSIKKKFMRDTNRRIWVIAINNGWNTHIVQILREIRDDDFLFKRKFLSIVLKPVELPHKQTKKFFNH